MDIPENSAAENPRIQAQNPASIPASNPSITIAWPELAKGQREIQIAYEDQIYRLRLTRNGKLILTK